VHKERRIQCLRRLRRRSCILSAGAAALKEPATNELTTCAEPLPQAPPEVPAFEFYATSTRGNLTAAA
jgi:hypothetical protein